MENQALTITVDPGDGTPPRTFELPEGWTRSPNRNTSSYAMQVAFGKHAWRGVYLNDGRGNGYFAPGWSGRRLARNMRIIQRIAAAATIVLVLFLLGFTGLQIRGNAEYYRLASEGIETEATVTSVQVERSHRVGLNGRSPSYTTRTAAEVIYPAEGRTHAATLREKATRSTGYPEPEWAAGERVRIYADRADPGHVVPFSSFLDGRSGPVNSTFWFIAVGGLGLTAVPGTIWLVARNARRKAEAL